VAAYCEKSLVKPYRIDCVFYLVRHPKCCVSSSEAVWINKEPLATRCVARGFIDIQIQIDFSLSEDASFRDPFCNLETF